MIGSEFRTTTRRVPRASSRQIRLAVAALSGERLAARDDQIWIAGQRAGRLGPTRRRTLGLSVVPEERHGHGAVLELSLSKSPTG